MAEDVVEERPDYGFVYVTEGEFKGKIGWFDDVEWVGAYVDEFYDDWDEEDPRFDDLEYGEEMAIVYFEEGLGGEKAHTAHVYLEYLERFTGPREGFTVSPKLMQWFQDLHEKPWMSGAIGEGVFDHLSSEEKIAWQKWAHSCLEMK